MQSIDLPLAMLRLQPIEPVRKGTNCEKSDRARDMLIYKISDTASWRTAESRGSFAGSPDDARDGFIHLSTAAQVRGTAGKHFAGQQSLLIAAIEAAELGAHLKWEASRGGALFPHFYGALPMSAVRWTKPLPLGADGLHAIPDEVV